MAATCYAPSLKNVLLSEGGFSDNAADPGGATNKGITLAEARKVFGASYSVAQLKDIAPSQVASIYRADYWNKINADALPGGVDYALFDYAVNSGVGRAVLVMRELLGMPKGTTIDRDCIAALARYDDGSVIDSICNERLEFMQAIEGGKLWHTFGKGWGARVASVRSKAKAMMAQPAVDSFVDTTPHATAKAITSPPVASTSVAATVSGGVVAAGSAAGVVHASGSHAWAIGIGLVAGLAAVGGVAAFIIGEHHAAIDPKNTLANGGAKLKLKGA